MTKSLKLNREFIKAFNLLNNVLVNKVGYLSFNILVDYDDDMIVVKDKLTIRYRNNISNVFYSYYETQTIIDEMQDLVANGSEFNRFTEVSNEIDNINLNRLLNIIDEIVKKNCEEWFKSNVLDENNIDFTPIQFYYTIEEDILEYKIGK